MPVLVSIVILTVVLAVAGAGNSGDGATSSADDGVSFRVAAVPLVVLATPSRNAVAGGGSGGAALLSVGSTSPAG